MTVAAAVGAAIATWFLRAQPPAVPTQVVGTPAVRGPCKGMTWVVLKQEQNVVHVGSDLKEANAYAGDTNCDVALPVLCLKPGGLPANPWSSR